MRLWCVAFALLMGIGCATSPRPTAHLLGEGVQVIGHRGARGLAPENSMAAFQLAADLRVPFELDTRLCATGELVVFHDETLDRLTGEEGRVLEQPWQRLSGLDVGAHFGPEFTGETMPLLVDVLQTFGDEAIINIEVKAEKGSDLKAMAEGVSAAVRSHDLQDRVFVSSFNPFFLEAMREADPTLIRGQLYATFEGADLKGYERFLLKNLAFNRRTQPDMLLLEGARATPRHVRKWSRRGYPMLAWTINEEEEVARLVALGVDAIITDRPDLVLSWLGQPAPAVLQEGPSAAPQIP